MDLPFLSAQQNGLKDYSKVFALIVDRITPDLCLYGRAEFIKPPVEGEVWYQVLERLERNLGERGFRIEQSDSQPNRYSISAVRT